MTTFRAAPGEIVIVDGADPLTGWQAMEGKIWSASWPHAFAETPKPRGWPENTWGFPLGRREMVWVDGQPLRPVATRDVMAPGTFFVDDAGKRLLVWLLDGGAPAERQTEASMRGPLWNMQHCSHVRLEGLTFQHATGPVQTSAAVNLPDCEAMEVIGCRILWNGGTGLFVWRGSKHRIENNTILFNGGSGIGGRLDKSLVKNNETSYNNWRSALGGVFGWAFAGIKIMEPKDTRVEDHVAVNNLARGIWFDFNHRDNVIDRALVHGNVDRGVYLEAGIGPNWLTNSVISGTRGLGQGLCIANAPDQHIHRNTFLGNAGPGARIGGSHGPRGTTPDISFATNADLQGNLFYNAGKQAAIEV